MSKLKLFCILGILSLITAPSTFAQQTLDDVKKRGKLNCGVSEGLVGFSMADSSGYWEGLDVDFCRALSAAIFGDSEKVNYVPLTGKARFAALRSGQVDLLSRITTHTLGRDTKEGVNFAPVTFYDGQGIMVSASSGIQDVFGLEGKKICVLTGTTTIVNLRDYLADKGITFSEVSFEHRTDILSTFTSGGCDAITDDSSALASVRVGLSGSYNILPERLSKEPLAPVVREGDDEWLDIVTWTVYATIAAEELGISYQNISKPIIEKSTDSNIQIFLGETGDLGASMGLSSDWAYDIISQVGNYRDIFDFNVGQYSILGLETGLNGLWSNGGLMYAPPMK